MSVKIGLSTYSLQQEIDSGRMTLPEVLTWMGEQGADHAELVPFSYTLIDNQPLIDAALKAAADAGVEIANYAILADLCQERDEDLKAEIARVKAHVDVAHALGLKSMRHDISSFRRPISSTGILQYERELPRMAQAAREIADYAAGLGITTLLENHGFFVNGTDRVIRLIDLVGRDNYRLLLDTGNVACVDEQPEIAVAKCASMAYMVHLKDFYIRAKDPGDATQFDCGGSWFRSVGGKFLRGAILGQGDLDIEAVLGALKRSGFDGCLTIEFEGMEPCLYAAKVSLDNARRIWERV